MASIANYAGNKFSFPINAIPASTGTQTWTFDLGASTQRVSGWIAVKASIDCSAGG